MAPQPARSGQPTPAYLENERFSLRQELQSLKNCQFTLLTSAIAATGVIFGFVGSLASAVGVDRGLVFLSPLFVLVPAWWTFFDKATTITRIVGYYRIVEGMLLGYYGSRSFVGWENALGEFRKRQESRELEKFAAVTLPRPGRRPPIFNEDELLAVELFRSPHDEISATDASRELCDFLRVSLDRPIWKEGSPEKKHVLIDELVVQAAEIRGPWTRLKHWGARFSDFVKPAGYRYWVMVYFIFCALSLTCNLASASFAAVHFSMETRVLVCCFCLLTFLVLATPKISRHGLRTAITYLYSVSVAACVYGYFRWVSPESRVFFFFFIVGWIFWAASTSVNAGIVRQLVGGRHSYGANERFWKLVLHIHHPG